MNPFANIFDAELVQFKTRQQVINLIASVVCVISAMCILVAVAGSTTIIPLWITAIGVGTGICSLFYILDRLQRTRRIAWCLKITDSAVVGYDFSRQRHVIRWNDVASVDLTDDALIIHSRDRSVLEIPHMFNEFEQLSHVLRDHTDQHHVRMTVNGKTISEIDVYNLFPVLTEYSRAA